MASDGLAEKWANPVVFSQYETSRQAVGPAFTLAIQSALGYLPPHGNILEIGAGAGALRYYAGEAAHSFKWTESDHNPDFLLLNRPDPVEHIVAKLPDIPVEDGSLDAIVGLGVLDTLETKTIEDTVSRANEVLSPEGVLLHIMDLAPDLNAEICNSKADGLFPLPYMADGDIGICYVSVDDAEARVIALNTDPAVISVFLALLKDPEKHLPMADRSAILPFLGSLAVKNDLAAATYPSWMKHFGNRLTTIVQERGFKVIINDYVQKQALQMRHKVPPALREAHLIMRAYGAVRAVNDKHPYMPNHITAVAKVHVFAAQKGKE